MLNLDDEAFGRALDNSIVGSQQRSSSLPVNQYPQTMTLQNVDFGSNYQNQLMAQQPVPLLAQNPFNELQSQPQKALSYEVISTIPAAQADPFADMLGSQSKSFEDPKPFIPMPLAPGTAPINHLSIANNNIGAKPVAPFQMAPHFSAASRSPNRNQSEPKSAQEDPFNMS